MQAHRSPAGRPTPTTFVLHFTAGDDAHLAADRLEQLGFRAVVHWPEDGSWQWQLEAGCLTTPETQHGVLHAVEQVADRYYGRVDHAHGGWAPAGLELVQRPVEPQAGELAELKGLWTHLTEATANNDPSPFTTLCAEWVAELERRFGFEPPVDDGWITIEVGAEGHDA